MVRPRVRYVLFGLALRYAAVMTAMHQMHQRTGDQSEVRHDEHNMREMKTKRQTSSAAATRQVINPAIDPRKLLTCVM